MTIHGLGPFRLDTQDGLLLRGREPVALGRRAIAVLQALVERPGALLSKDALIEAGWPSQSVEESNLTVQIAELRRVLSTTPGGDRWIETMPRRGYRFIGPVNTEAEKDVTEAPPQVEGTRDPAPPSPQGEAERGQPLPVALAATATILAAEEKGGVAPRLSIVVLPFANIGGDLVHEYFVDGLTESLTTDLSRISGSFVIARSTAFGYKGKPVDARAIGRELNVRYVLEGSVQRAGGRMRVNVQLIDTESGAHLWLERFDRPLADLFDTQDDIVARLANALNAQLVTAEARRGERAPNPDAMDLYFQGMAWLNKGLTLEYESQARGLFERALMLDPCNVGALVGSAAVDAGIAATYIADDRRERLARAEAALTEALSMAPDHAWAHVVMGVVKTYTNRAAQGIAECERALALDPNFAEAHAVIGLAKLVIGRFEETDSHIQEAMHLSPRDKYLSAWLVIAGIAQLYLGYDDGAVTCFRRSIEITRNHPGAQYYLAGALALLGRLEEARSAVRAAMALHPDFTVSRFRAGAASDNPRYLEARERLCDGMRKAGVHEQATPPQDKFGASVTADAIGALKEAAAARAPPSPSTAARERRQLTIMQCAMSGPAFESAQCDPEDLHRLLTAFHESCAAIIANVGGAPARLLNDGILAYFGYPQADEHQAERAIRAARARW
jgi:TolB-like protein/DNA-binding winged helix-turn-helix (wHTH) protein/Tfp pilus assembly protein PilF